MLCTATFFDGFDGLVIQSALPLILTAMGVSLASAGVIVSAQFWGGVIGGLSAGILAERYGRRRVLLASCGILGLTSIFVAFAQDFNQLVLARTVQGAAGAMEIPIAGAMFNEFVKSSHRGTAVYVYETMYAWGGYVAPWLGLAFIALVGQNEAWRGMFLFGALPLLMVLIRKRALPESPRWLLNQGRVQEAQTIIEQFELSAEKRAGGQPLAEPVVIAQPQIKKTNFLELFQSQYRGRTIMMLVWIMMVYAFTFGYRPFIAALYVTVGGLPIASALALTIAGQLISIPWNYFVAFTLDRFGRRFYFGWGLVFGALVMAIGAIVVGSFGLKSWPVLFAVTQITAMAATSTIGFFVYVPELYPTRMRAWATSVGSTGLYFVSSFMPIVVGLTAASALGLGGVYVLMAVCLLIGGFTLLRFGPETSRRVLEEIAA